MDEWERLIGNYIAQLEEHGIVWHPDDAQRAYRAAYLAMSGDWSPWNSLRWPMPRNLGIVHMVGTVSYEQLTPRERTADAIAAERELERLRTEFERARKREKRGSP